MLYKEQELKLYNSLTKSKEVFESVHKGKVGMYVCGPTVYSFVHLGNCRTFISFDLVFRYLKFLGYNVKYVRNITDVGHLEYDSDDGEDKISKKAKAENVQPMEIVQTYTLDFHKVLSQFNTLPPSIEPTATGHIIEQIAHVQKLIDNGFAYESEGSVYFDIEKYNKTYDYGELSGRILEESLNESRNLSGSSEKKSPQDFALWKKASDSHIMRWQSPWSDGFPGWHLECTAMSTKYLGEKFDIHGGGIDLKFPHHECEIAQAKGAFGEEPVNYWLHANMLTLNGQKMSKSTGNTILPEQLFSGKDSLFSKSFSPSVVRFFMLQAHYRSVLDMSEEALIASEKGYNRLMNSFETLEEITSSEDSNYNIKDWIQKCFDAMNDDFNSPILISHLFESSKIISDLKNEKISLSETDLNLFKSTLNSFTFDVLGLEKPVSQNSSSGKSDEVIEMVLNLRNEARANRNWGLSDKIRDNLKEIGIEIKDEKDGSTTFKHKS